MSFFEEQNYGHEIQEQLKKSKEIVCEFCNNSNYYNRAVNAQHILASNGVYQGRYFNIDDKIRSLNDQLRVTEQKKDALLRHFRTTDSKNTIVNTLNDLRQQLASATADRTGLISLYDDYKNYVSTLPEMESNTWKIRQHTLSDYNFYDELKKCEIAVNAGIGVPDEYSSNEPIPTAGIGVVIPDEYSSNKPIPTASPIGGRKSKKRKSRKSSRKSRKSSRKSRKSSRKSRK
jgi:hypothetical protein